MTEPSRLTQALAVLLLPAASAFVHHTATQAWSGQRTAASQRIHMSTRVHEASSLFGMPLAPTISSDFQRVKDLRESHWRVPERRMPTIVRLRKLFETAKVSSGNSPLTEEECLAALLAGGYAAPTASAMRTRKLLFEHQRGERWVCFKIFTEFVRMSISETAPSKQRAQSAWDKYFTTHELWDHSMWEAHSSADRGGRISKTMAYLPRSSTMQAVKWPLIFFLSAFAIFDFCNSKLPGRIFGSQIAVTMHTSAIGVLLGFRVNSAYQRFVEGRQLLGLAILASRQLAQGFRTWGTPEECRLCARYLVCFAWSLKATLCAYETSEDVLRVLLPESEVNHILSSSNVPMTILGRIRDLTAHLVNKRKLPMASHHRFLEDITSLHTALGGCERILRTPIPPTYTRHVTRALVMWLCGVFFTLQDVHLSFVNQVLLVVAKFGISYTMLGIDELATQIEQPFQFLPLWGTCHTIQQTTLEICGSEMPVPPLPLSATAGATSTSTSNINSNSGSSGSADSTTASSSSSINSNSSSSNFETDLHKLEQQQEKFEFAEPGWTVTNGANSTDIPTTQVRV